jgi:hypothetical protein
MMVVGGSEHVAAMTPLPLLAHADAHAQSSNSDSHYFIHIHIISSIQEHLTSYFISTRYLVRASYSLSLRNSWVLIYTVSKDTRT